MIEPTRMNLQILAFFLLFLSGNLFAKTEYFYIPPEATEVSDIDHMEYAKILQDFSDLYSPIVLAETNKKLLVNHDWISPFFGAFSTRRSSHWEISLLGGMARAPGSTKSALITILCHELGHILGGDPRQNIPGGEWASAEGQADFYASSQCLPLFFKTYTEYMVTAEDAPNRLCKNSFVCGNTIQGGLDFLRLAQKYSYREFVPVEVDVTAPPTATPIINTYPSDQCRLDTYKAGALCATGSCERPKCWWM